MTEAAAQPSTPAVPPVMPHRGVPPSAEPAPERKIEPLRPNLLQTRSATVLDFAVMVPALTMREDILSGEFWVHVANRLPVYSEIRVLWEDGSQYARILVTHSAGRFSQFKCLEWHRIDEAPNLPMAEDETIKVESKGPRKWCLVDANSGDILKDMIPTKIGAMKEREDMLRARAR